MADRKALVVGISDYPDGHLVGCKKDADQIAALLGLPEYNFDEIVVLTDSDATRSRMKEELIALSSASEMAVFYFAGHGYSCDLGAHLVAVDGEPNDEGVELAFLRKVIEIRCAKANVVLVILDCCHSGAAWIGGTAGGLITNRDVNDTLYFSVQEGRVVLAACRANENAYATEEHEHGIFTWYLLQGLMGEASDGEGVITVSGLHDYIAKNFEAGTGQTPVFRGAISGRMVIAKGFPVSATPSIDKADIRDFAVQAETLLADYHKKTSDFPHDVWKRSGHRQACDYLTPILQWFNRKIRQYPALLKVKDFSSHYEAVISKLQTLGAIEPGIETKKGLITERIGSGTFGTVWKIKQENDTDLVYKVYHPQDLWLRDKRARFQRGYEAMQQMDHPHIVSVNEFTECPMGFFMEFIPGPNFREFTGTISEPAEITRLLLTIGETLKHAHERGVVHRDVKPENILLRYEQEAGNWIPFLTDFDLAWFSTATQVTKEAMGTVFYAAPEQLYKPTSPVAHAPTTDVYSFGQLCFYALTRSDPMPQEPEKNSKLLINRLEGWVTERAAREFLSLYERSTKYSPEERPADFRLICDELYSIHNSLGSADLHSELSFNEFLSELKFSIVGLPVVESSGDLSFGSISQRTRVTVHPELTSAKEISFQFQFVLVAAYPLTDGQTFEGMRKTINSRIDLRLSKFQGARRRSGSQGTYEVIVEVDNVPMSFEGINHCRQIITRVLDCIEGI